MHFLFPLDPLLNVHVINIMLPSCSLYSLIPSQQSYVHLDIVFLMYGYSVIAVVLILFLFYTGSSSYKPSSSFQSSGSRNLGSSDRDTGIGTGTSSFQEGSSVNHKELDVRPLEPGDNYKVREQLADLTISTSSQ